MTDPAQASTTSAPNFDIFIPAWVHDRFKLVPSVDAVLTQPALEKRFGEADAGAALHKKVHVYGRTTTLLLSTVAVCLTVVSLVGWSIRSALPPWIDPATAGAGIAAILIELAMRIGGTQSRWLRHRHVAERIRHWRYHQFLSGPLVSAGDYVARRDTDWTSFEKTISSEGELERFLGAHLFQPAFGRAPYSDPALFAKALEAYRLLRLEYQERHFRSQANGWGARDATTRALASALLLLAAAGSVVGALSGRFDWGRTNPWVTATLAGVSVGLAVLSAAMRAHRSSAGHAEHRIRYETKANALLALRSKLDATSDDATRLDAMVQVERVCHEELVEFLRTSERTE